MEEPVGIESGDVRASACGDDDGGLCLSIMPLSRLICIFSQVAMIIIQQLIEIHGDGQSIWHELYAAKIMIV